MRAPLDVDAAWARYRDQRGLEARNVLVEHYLPIVDRVAAQLKPFLARHADQDDIVSYGTIGLIDAVTKFDPAKSSNFLGFAWKRIKGEILDELRRADEVQRSLRTAGRQIEVARNILTERLQRAPSRQEIAGELGMTVSELDRVASSLVATEVVSMEATRTESTYGQLEGGQSIKDLIADVGDDPTDEYEIDELRHVVAVAWNSLPERERTVLRLRYIEGLTLSEAANVLGVATSRASQLSTEAVRLLRAGIAVL